MKNVSDGLGNKLAWERINEPEDNRHSPYWYTEEQSRTELGTQRTGDHFEIWDIHITRIPEGHRRKTVSTFQA